MKTENKKNQKVSTRLSNYDYNRIVSLVEKGICLNQSDFFREAIKKELEYQEQRIKEDFK